MTLQELSFTHMEAAAEALGRCCGSRTWIYGMIAARPFRSMQHLLDSATKVWDYCSEKDGREAFRHHPKIGSVDELAAKFASTAQWAGGEQASVQQASRETLEALAKGNDEYEQKFGYIFIVCATGKSAEEMLALLQERLPNRPEVEIHIAMAEQLKITHIRLEKLMST